MSATPAICCCVLFCLFLALLLLLFLGKAKASEFEVFAKVDMDGHEIIQDGENFF